MTTSRNNVFRRSYVSNPGVPNKSSFKGRSPPVGLSNSDPRFWHILFGGLQKAAHLVFISCACGVLVRDLPAGRGNNRVFDGALFAHAVIAETPELSI